MARPGPTSVEEYLAALTPEQRAWIDELRATIREVLPDADEVISYQIVAYKVGGKAVVWYAAFGDHYSLYPATDTLRAALGDRIKPHLSGKGTLRFAPDQAVPRDLVREIVRVRLAEATAGYR